MQWIRYRPAVGPLSHQHGCTSHHPPRASSSSDGFLYIIEENVWKMLEQFIDMAELLWNLNIMLVSKKDGMMRCCVDYCCLNDVTYKDSYPLPRTESCLESLSGCKYYLTLDLHSGYWQTTMDSSWHWQDCVRDPLWNVPIYSLQFLAKQCAKWLMDLVLAGLTWDICLMYIYDIIVYAKTFE